MVVSLNSALVSKSSSNIAFGNSHKNSVRLVPQEGDKFLSTGITHQKSFMRKARTLAVAALAMFGAYSCTPGSNEPILPNPPVVVNPPVVPPVVTPPVTGALTDGQKMARTYLGEVGAIDTLTEKGIVNQLDYYNDGDGYNHSKKYTYPTDGSKKFTVNDVITTQGDTITQSKEVLVQDATNPRLLKAESFAMLEKGKWVNSYSKYSHLIGNGFVTDIVDGKEITKLSKDTPLKILGLNIQNNFKYNLNITKKVISAVK